MHILSLYIYYLYAYIISGERFIYWKHVLQCLIHAHVSVYIKHQIVDMVYYTFFKFMYKYCNPIGQIKL